jgi:hypothetical protein
MTNSTPASSPRTSPRDIILLAFGVVVSLAIFWGSYWLLGYLGSHIQPPADGQPYTRTPIEALWLLAYVLYTVLPWIPVIVTVRLVRRPLISLGLPLVTILCLLGSEIALETFQDHSCGHVPPCKVEGWDIVVNWAQRILYATWTSVMPALAIWLWARSRANHDSKAPLPEPTSDAPTPRDIGPILLASFGPAACWLVAYLLKMGVIPISNWGFASIMAYLATYILPWGFVGLAIRLSRRPDTCRRLPIIAMIVMAASLPYAMVCHIFNTHGWEVLFVFTRELVLLSLSLPAMLLLAHRRATTLPSFPPLYSPGLAATVGASMLGPGLIGQIVFWLSNEPSIISSSLLWIVLAGVPLAVTLIIARTTRTGHHLCRILFIAALVNVIPMLILLGLHAADSFYNYAVSMALFGMFESILLMGGAALVIYGHRRTKAMEDCQES